MKKRNIVIPITVLIVCTLLGAIAFKLYNFILPYRNVDKASHDFLNIDTVTDYKLIKHYYDRTGTFVTRPIFAVDIEYTEDVYRQKKTEEINGRTDLTDEIQSIAKIP